MLNLLALLVILLTGVYFIGLAVVALTVPARATHFLFGFASSAITHYFELSIRIVIGCAFLLRAPQMPFSEAFSIFGWILIITTTCLFLVPWKWHHRFARWAVPHAIRQLKLVAVASLVLGGLVLASALSGGVA
jgi:hypothetical protein